MRVFGDRLGEARAAMEALAASHPPQKERASEEEWRAQVGRKRIMACALGGILATHEFVLNRTIRPYERFRPDVPEGARDGARRGVADGADCRAAG